jgi:hypothetical protein
MRRNAGESSEQDKGMKIIKEGKNGGEGNSLM